MKRIFFTLTAATFFLAFSGGNAIAQTAAKANSSTKVNTSTKSTAKPRISRTNDTSMFARYRQRSLLRITDTTGIGLGLRSDSLRRLNFKPGRPALPVQNNPNPYSNSPVVHPDRPALKTPAIAPKTKTKD
ncbi:hypothetical protein [Pararcticibacter amylolyticus]|uniref:Uncharacterized protein n=1 Tax=Pararcticibacter amylolyticus TaxID=2173175 RepID=A0A2U2PJW5_9SPHI|nr:hypothetical protein [Pararcticibacter amylolyticus]PWG81680.1 hypothetical protein DDR33_04715 [Pararcticibacter amylolyticus]